MTKSMHVINSGGAIPASALMPLYATKASLVSNWIQRLKLVWKAEQALSAGMAQ